MIATANQKKKLREMLKSDDYGLMGMYNYLGVKEICNNIVSRCVLKGYVHNMIDIDKRVSHVLEMLENEDAKIFKLDFSALTTKDMVVPIYTKQKLWDIITEHN